MTKGNQQWIGKEIFCAKQRISDTTPLTLWWYPPVTEASTKPHPESYMLRRLFLWMPRKAWAVDFKCPRCPECSLQ